MGRGRGLFGWVCLRDVGVLRYLAGIPLFWAMTPIRDCAFWIFVGHYGV